MQAISDARAEMIAAVGSLHTEFSGFKAETEARVDALEEDARSAKLWHRIQTVCVVPVVGALHQVASHFGWIK